MHRPRWGVALVPRSALRGMAGIANARLAYAAFVETTQSARWRALAASGAQVQRPLWASTGTKNPAYPDTLYVDALIGPGPTDVAAVHPR